MYCVLLYYGNQAEIQTGSESKLMDQVREVLRYHHYAYRAEKTYCDWIAQYIKGVST